ncbi:hypothetical protein GCM10011607_28680 [Shewanella inventionis]|uniref:Uncharacterized protein n=1 Tax=Shewanella inventionis TaxID=1738770 RepID=A0ABQ1JED4_9GAMM|nr:hypothetical protein [Shewanella inventionis]GGB66271.1 hypothetical protein GCM10011607_28680 [Shewanella inventionis]
MAANFKTTLFMLAFMSCASFAQDSQDIANQEAAIAAQSLKQYKDAAIAVYQDTGVWPSSVTNLNTKMPIVPKFNGKYKSPSIIQNSNGSISIVVQAGSAAEAKRLADQSGEVYTLNGSTVSMLVTPPTGSNLRSVYKTQIDSTNKTTFSVTDDISINGNDVINAGNVSVNNLKLKCLELGSSKVCENSTGVLDVTTDLAKLTSNGQVDQSIASDVVSILNKLKANEIDLAELVSANTVATDLIVTAANLDKAQIDTMDAIVASMKAVLVNELSVTGSTTLADIVATSGTLTSITGSDINVSGLAVMNTLQGNGLLAGNAFVDAANVQNLITNIGSLENLKTNLIQTNSILADHGSLTDIKSVSANFNEIIIKDGDSGTLNTQTFKGKIVELGAAVIKATLAVDQLNVDKVVSDEANIKSLQSDSATITTVKTTNATVTGKTETGSIEVSSDALFNGDVTVDNKVTTTDLSISNNFTVANLLTTMRLVVNNDAIIAGLLTTKDLAVNQTATIGKTMTVSANSTAYNMNVNNAITAKTVNVSGNALATGQVTAGSVTSKSANVSGIVNAGEVRSDSITSTTMNSSNWTSDRLTSGSLISQYNAALAKAVIQNMTAQTSSLGSSTGASLTLSKDLTAKNGSFETLNVTAEALMGSFTAESGKFNTNLNVSGKVTSKNLDATNISAVSSNITTLNTAGFTVSGLVKGGTVKTSSGNSLASVNNIYINHEGRIISIEQFKSECINNWVYACAGTLPRLTDTNCVGCTQTSYSSGSFTATASAKIQDCPAGCTYTWTTSSGVGKSSCSNGSVSAGQTKSVSCAVVSSPDVVIGKTLTSSVKLEVAHSGKGSINTGNQYPISWTFEGETPSINTPACPRCTTSQIGYGIFNASYSATIANCSAGCNYQWVFGNGVAADVCASGSVNAGQSKAVSCNIISNPAVSPGQTLNSTLQLIVMNSKNASFTSSHSQPVRWEYVKSTPTPTISVASCKFSNNGDCSLPGSGSFGYLDVIVTYSIGNCDPSCSLVTTLGSGLTATDCSPSTVFGNTTATCRFRNSSALAQGETLNTSITKAKVTNNDDSTKTAEITSIPLSLQNGTAPVSAPSVSLSCSGCSDQTEGKSSFSAVANSTITTCAGGCTYSWVLGSGLTKTACTNGSVNSNGTSYPSCTFKNTSALASGAKLNSSVSLTATNIGDTSKKTTKTISVIWENVKAVAAQFMNSFIISDSNVIAEQVGSFKISADGTYQACDDSCRSGNWIWDASASEYEYLMSPYYDDYMVGATRGGHGSIQITGTTNTWGTSDILFRVATKASTNYGSIVRGAATVDVSFRKKGTTTILKTVTIQIHVSSENT